MKRTSQTIAERESMRQSILEKAHALFMEQGFHKTSLRSLARALDCSPGTIYLYFKDKDELWSEIQNRAFEPFFQQLSDAARSEDPVKRLRDIACAYVDFALDMPQHYELMFLQQAPMNADQNAEHWNNGKLAHDLLARTIQDCLDQGRVAPGEPELMTFNCWSHVHGMCALVLRGRTRFYHDINHRSMLHRAVEDYINRIQTAKTHGI